MPDCQACEFFDGHVCRAHGRALQEYGRPIPPAPIGACTLAIVESYRSLIQPGMRVLEIGCGTWPLLKTICEETGAKYESIDTQAEYFGKKSIATRIENLQSLSFEDEEFDLVIGNQTIEHWAEFGCPTSYGLFQCFRVCKPGGQVIMNAPVHFHGSSPFLMGDFQAIEDLYRPYSGEIHIERWGHDTSPMPPFVTYEDYPPLAGKGAYIIDIRARKDLPRGSSPQVLPLPMKIRRWANYPASFLWYRARLKFGLAKK